jgi:ABC-type lipoprotein export system ATPase subunit
MQCRYEDISEAHLRTFEWIFQEDPDEECQNYTAWLRSGQGIYWIQGKAASGKSTLMRFISEDKRSVEYL